MAYVLGVSSGMFMAASQEEKEQFLTIPRKIFRGGLEGVNFTQLDIESITEFVEPYLKQEAEKIRELGIRFGVHGESYAMGGMEKPISLLDSCIESNYLNAHIRLLQHIEGCGKIKAEYINIHPSETPPFPRLSMHLQPTKLVDFYGRPLEKFLKENKDILEWAAQQDFINDIMRAQFRVPTEEDILEDLKRRYEVVNRKKPGILEEAELRIEAKKRRKETLETLLLNFVSTTDLAYGSERLAYYITAKWMQRHNDQLWKTIVGKNMRDKDLPELEKIRKWVPAVAAKYIWGHFNPKDPKYKDPKPLLEKYKIRFIFETQMGESGVEGLHRFSRPRDMIFLCKAIKSNWVGVCFDFEHVMSHNIDPKEEIESIPFGMAKYIKVCHLGFPTPHVPAHMPIPYGSREQFYLYERIFELRKKGFEDGWLIFERGAAGRGTSLLAMRKIKEFLEKDTVPKELPLSFYGLEEGAPDIKKQEVAIREHALDPLRGVLAIPEEEFTFLSKAAVEKQKAKEWEAEKYK